MAKHEAISFLFIGVFFAVADVCDRYRPKRSSIEEPPHCIKVSKIWVGLYDWLQTQQLS
jgi:hypothetical protein